MVSANSRVKCAVIGYGGNWDFGRMHCRWIGACDDLDLVAVCDISEASRIRAEHDFPGISVYDSVDALLQHDGLEMVTIVTPHNTHADIAVQCLQAGKHVICEKAMATTIEDCTRMIDAANAAGKKLAVFHNRRHDGNYRAIVRTIRDGGIGDVFHVECCEERHQDPGDWWYSDAEKSGGLFFFWGPHAVDWVLHMMPSPVARVAGSIQKRVWHNVDIADEVRAYLWFEGGESAEITFSNIGALRRPLWRVLGTHGAILDSKFGRISGAYIPHYGELLVGDAGVGQIRVVKVTEDGQHEENMIDYLSSDWLTYYQEMAHAVINDGPVPVSGEEGRMTVAVMLAAEESGRAGGTMIEMSEYVNR